MKKPFKALSCAAALSALAAFSLPAAAQSAGSNVFGVGWFHLSPNDSSEPLTRTGTIQPGPIAGSGATIDSADTLGLTVTHFWTDNLATTLDFGIPPRFHLSAQGASLAAAGVTDIGSAKQWSPAIVGKWFFGDANSKFRPFIGGGVTYVWYSGVQLSQAFQNAAALTSGTGVNGAASAHLSSSWAPVANIGATYNFDKNWSASFSVSYIPLKTNADVTAQNPNPAIGTQTSRTTLTINPLVTLLSVGYTF
jgi:outer membrane protein